LVCSSVYLVAIKETKK